MSTTPTCKLVDGELHFLHHCSHVGIQEDGQVLGRLPIGPAGVPFRDGGGWEVDVDADGQLVNVRPSIECLNPGCGCHGFWTAGVWVPAG